MKRPRILIVDDEPDIRDILKLTLGQEDYEVIEAGDGEEAVQAEQPHLRIVEHRLELLAGRLVIALQDRGLRFEKMDERFLVGADQLRCRCR